MAIGDIRETEAQIREAEAATRSELFEARAALETAGRDDRAAYAAALAAGDELPKEGRTPKLVAQIRDIEKRRLPAFDDALWLVAEQTREEVRGDIPVDRFRSMRRWNPPHAVNDPSQPAATRHGVHRPPDVVAWVQGVHDVIVQSQAKRHDEAERAERKREAERRVNRAQTLYNAEQQKLLEEADAKKSPAARMHAQVARQAQPWAPFDRRAFLEREGLLEDYGYVQPGQSIQVQGGNTQEIEFVPRGALQPTATEA